MAIPYKRLVPLQIIVVVPKGVLWISLNVAKTTLLVHWRTMKKVIALSLVAQITISRLPSLKKTCKHWTPNKVRQSKSILSIGQTNTNLPPVKSLKCYLMIMTVNWLLRRLYSTMISRQTLVKPRYSRPIAIKSRLKKTWKVGKTCAIYLLLLLTVKTRVTLMMPYSPKNARAVTIGCWWRLLM